MLSQCEEKHGRNPESASLIRWRALAKSLDRCLPLSYLLSRILKAEKPLRRL
jgi:hypothetical protein